MLLNKEIIVIKKIFLSFFPFKHILVQLGYHIMSLTGFFYVRVL